MLASAGLSVRPVDPDALPHPVRELLPEWAHFWADQVKKAQAK